MSQVYFNQLIKTFFPFFKSIHFGVEMQTAQFFKNLQDIQKKAMCLHGKNNYIE